MFSTHFGGTFGTTRFDKKSFFHTLLGFPAYWDYKPNNAVHSDGHGVYTSDKISNSNTINEIHLKCDVIDGSIQNGSGQPIFFFIFNLDKPTGYKFFSEPETIHYKKFKKSV